ncbi:hypothetical protein C0Q70_14410 [Pomacea canaliculata]|uniref:Uncharacterized protein n=1 Tax=Pomacea canaliculata TaxID=400727 RepID=A0A2T7NZZ3_POMCA|nr:hypothetical protein C0Q70_14410 [Pomacea canaliculata]
MTGQTEYVCYGELGHYLYQFSGDKVKVEFPCKFNAIRNQVCGDYQITFTPGNAWNGVRYLTYSAWLGVTRLSDDKAWYGRTTIKIAGQYVKEMQCQGSTNRQPYNKKGGDLELADIFDVSIASDGLSVIVTEKNNVFSLEFGLYEVSGDRQSSSDWKFICNAANVKLVPYPQQLCGNGTNNYVRKRTDKMSIIKDEEAAVIYDVFTNPTITQYDTINPLCEEAQGYIINSCVNDTAREEAVALCWRTVGSAGHRQCLSKYTYDPMQVFTKCVDWACSGFPSPAKDIKKNCNALAEAVDDCREFPGLKTKIDKAHCYSGLRWVLDGEEEGCPQ